MRNVHTDYILDCIKFDVLKENNLRLLGLSASQLPGPLEAFWDKYAGTGLALDFSDLPFAKEVTDRLYVSWTPASILTQPDGEQFYLTRNEILQRLEKGE